MSLNLCINCGEIFDDESGISCPECDTTTFITEEEALRVENWLKDFILEIYKKG